MECRLLVICSKLKFSFHLYVSQGVSQAKSLTDKYIWLKLCKKFFALQEDTFVAIIYIPPVNSTYCRVGNNDLMGDLEKDVQHFSKMGSILLMGDFNGRTATEPDLVLSDSISHGPLVPDYDIDHCPTKRLNQDNCLNERGKALLDMCVSARLRILNGRKLGDSLGYFTCHKYNGSSTVDYVIVDEKMFPKIIYFHTHKSLSDLSDHCQISVGLESKKTICDNTPKIPMSTLPQGFKWEKDSVFKFQNALLSQNTQASIRAFLHTNYAENANELDIAVGKVNEIILGAAVSSLKRKTKSPKSTKGKKDWFTPDLNRMRKEIMNTGHKLCAHPRDSVLRGYYHSSLRSYRKACKQECRKFKNKLMLSLDELQNNDPKQYWDLIKKISGKGKEKQSPVDPCEFYDHYKTLNNREIQIKGEKEHILKELQELESIPVFNELDNRITDKEVLNTLRSLKNGKACGADLISNEMLKAGANLLLPVFTKIFNLSLSSGHFPNQWGQGRIMSIHKKGDVHDPSNYRGITITGCLGKVFNGILNSRISSFLESRDIIKQEQIGFRKGHRTTDHLFIINNLMKKYKLQRKNLFMCFVDYQKAFDSVWHLGLFVKLKRLGISDRFYSVIKSMYTNSFVSVQVDRLLSPYFKSLIGVRQGDNLSPTLFNTFVNDLPDIFDETCCPVSFGNLELQCLLYADDLVLFSESDTGLQKCLDKLYNYCDLWALDINVTKTKYMCTGKAPSKETFLFGDKQILRVSSYKYLGLELHEHGDMQIARKDLSRRALKAFYSLSKNFSSVPRVSILNHLFNHLVKPILLYGSEILGRCNLPDRTVNHNASDSESAKFFKELKINFPYISKYIESDDPLEKVHLRYCKFALGVHSKATNLAVYGELGRYPLFIDQAVSVAKYIYHMEYCSNNKLLKRFYDNLKSNNVLHGKNNVLTTVQNINNTLGINAPTHPKAVEQYTNRLRGKLVNNFKMYWSQMINTSFTKSSKGGNKLRTYKLFKQNFGYENYLNIANSKLRKELARFRTSSHHLKIETGRYNGRNIYVPPAERICQCCNVEAVEDESHFITECPLYQQNRASLYSEISKYNPYFSEYTNSMKLVWLLSNENIQCQKLLAEYLLDSMKLRLVMTSN